MSFFYFVDVLFNLFLVLRTLRKPKVLTVSRDELSKLENNSLPIYTILCPLYKEAQVIPRFLDSISKIDWDSTKLDVILLLEKDDTEAIGAVNNMYLPPYVRVEIVPYSQPKTKPKACNWGLSIARGEYVVVYDAEDSPDPLQLKKAYLTFLKQREDVICLQAKLNYYNPQDNLLTKLFTAEYSLWFDVILTGLQTMNTCIPLGGTSNHFRVKQLRELKAWDPFNVTEDADLGIRLFEHKYKTALIDSTTYEEANSKVKNWLRQRSRWIKGYMQTYLVHTRNPISFVKKNGHHALVFQLLYGGKIAFIFINPFLWAATIAYFTLNALVGPTIELLYPPYIFYVAIISLIFGNFMYVYYYMIGLSEREHWGLLKYLIFVPFYWLLVSWAGAIALWQLIFKPHYWEKTIHGLNKAEPTTTRLIETRKDLVFGT